MADIKEIKNKQERIRKRAAAREKLTSWFMINMCWAFLALVILRFVENGYNITGTMRYMNLIMRIAGGVFALGGGVLFFLWYRGGKSKERFYNYSIFSWVAAGSSLIIGFFDIYIRNFFRKIPFAQNWFLWQHSSWRTWLFMWGIGIYLIVAFVIYLVKMRKIK